MILYANLLDQCMSPVQSIQSLNIEKQQTFLPNLSTHSRQFYLFDCTLTDRAMVKMTFWKKKINKGWTNNHLVGVVQFFFFNLFSGSLWSIFLLHASNSFFNSEHAPPQIINGRPLEKYIHLYNSFKVPYP